MEEKTQSISIITTSPASMTRERVLEATQGQVAAIDGKTVRRLADKANGKSPIHPRGGRVGDRRLG